MKLDNLKKRIREEHEESFPEFDSDKVRYNILQELNKSPLSENYVRVNAFKYQAVFNVLMLIFLVLGTVIVCEFTSVGKAQSLNNTYDHPKHYHFQDCEASDPILVSSSYNGEELGIYQVMTRKGRDVKVQYFYIYKDIGSHRVTHLEVTNLDENEVVSIPVVNGCGNLSELININPSNNIKVTLLYDDNKYISQYFIASNKVKNHPFD